MSLLALSENPPALSPRATCVKDLTGPWIVAQTLSRFEKKLAWHLHDREIGYFLPMRRITKMAAGRRRKVQPILFPGYVFVADGSAGRIAASESHQICRFIEINDQQKFIKEIAALESALEVDPRLHACDWLSQGQRVVVRSGPLQGHEGIVEYMDRKAKLLLRISTLGTAAVLDIDPSMVEPIDA